MKIYVLCSCGDGLSDPVASADYNWIYEIMNKSYHLVVDHTLQESEEKEMTYISEYSARAVIHGTWIEWTITELDLVIPIPM